MERTQKIIDGLTALYDAMHENQCYACSHEFIEKANEFGTEILVDAIALLEGQPQIVRCKDCKRRGTYDCPVYVGGDGMYSEPDDWFCADGEKANPCDKCY